MALFTPKEEAPQPEGIQLTQEQLKDLMVTMARTMGEEMRKPTPEQEAKLEEDKKKRLREAEARIEVGRAEMQRRESMKRGCNHRMDQGKSEKFAIGAQLMSDGMIHVFCVRCCSDIRQYKPAPEQLSAG